MLLGSILYVNKIYHCGLEQWYDSKYFLLSGGTETFIILPSGGMDSAVADYFGIIFLSFFFLLTFFLPVFVALVFFINQ